MIRINELVVTHKGKVVDKWDSYLRAYNNLLLHLDGMDIRILVATASDDRQYDPIVLLQKLNQLGVQNDNPV